MHTRSILRGSLILALMLGVLSWSNCLEAQFVHLTVEVETTFWDCSAPSINTKTWTTECVVGTNCWLIRGDPFGSLVWSSGSNSVIKGERVLESADGNPGRPPGQTDFLLAPGKISWLAFCSGPLLSQKGEGLPLPSDLWKEYLPASWQTSEKITRFDDELGLPERLVLYHNSQPVLQYRVTLTTNVLDWTFPREFYLAQYIPAGTNAWQVHLTAKGRLLSIEERTQLRSASEQANSNGK
jgi:hypothetical protein